MKFIELKQHLLSKTYSSVYVVYGEDDSVIELATNLFKKQIEGFQDFNIISFDSKEQQPQKIIDACNTLPLMANFKLVIVNDEDSKEEKKDAAEKSNKANNLTSVLTEYLKQPNSQTILVVKTRENSAIYNKLKTTATLVDCNRLDAQTLKKIILNECKNYKVEILDPEIIKLIDVCGSNLGSINTELKKLISVCENNKITLQDIENNCAKNLEYSVFELSEALSQKNTQKAIAILDDMLINPKNQPLIMPLIASHFRRLFMVTTSNQTTSQKASLLGVKEYAVQKTELQAKKFSKKKLMDITKTINESEFLVKSGKANLIDTLYYLVMFILNN